MKSSTLNTMAGSVLAAAAGFFVFRAVRAKNGVQVADDVDMRNSQTVDKRESPNAAVDPAEQGLTQLDAAYREEWQANGFPQTHREMRELEEDK
ncbi:hypothetical protein QWY14_15585 [Planococcus sp. N028]|uniref:Uncharacterized protein n=1 Tax=Planococcus shixiaomingii TaxID=3058393 RepID=A0ABT8N5R6_9BACL|nr:MULTISPECIES: hypothetical protein [unclassified Planococcus (in: firmicutes)]MDN7243226.1 hypothetical protein [Planococcus sp. N028]WKA55169.1 hypothetical protein QWY21_01950 [Planococcus sp. N022]